MKMFSTNTVNFGIGYTFWKGPGSAFSKGSFFLRVRFIKLTLELDTRGVFRTQSNIYDGASFQKQLAAFNG